MKEIEAKQDELIELKDRQINLLSKWHLTDKTELERGEYVANGYLIKDLEQELSALKSKRTSQVDNGEKEMIDFILKIDFLTTVEFCKRFDVPLPKIMSSIQASADQFLQIDAIKHRMFVEKAKEINRRLPVSEPVKSEPLYDNETCYYLIERNQHPLWYVSMGNWTDDALQALKSTDKEHLEEYLKGINNGRIGSDRYFITEHLFMSEPVSNGNAEEIGREWIMDILEPYAREGNMNITFKGMVELIRMRILSEFASQSHKEVTLPEEGKGAESAEEFVLNHKHNKYLSFNRNEPDKLLMIAVILRQYASLPAKSVADEPKQIATKKELKAIESLRDDIEAMIGNSDTDAHWNKNIKIIDAFLSRQPKK